MNNYGKELILDIHNCDPTTFTRASLKYFCIDICKLINMERCEIYYWDYEGDSEGYDKAPDHLKGTTVVQFITTSDIRIHTLDVLKKVFVNIFTCKDFDTTLAENFTVSYFKGEVVKSEVVDRI